MTGKRTCRQWITVLAILICLGGWPWSVVRAAGSGVEVTEITDHGELARAVSDGWDDTYYAKVLVDTQNEEITVDGRETTFEEVFEVDNPSDVPEVESVQAVEEYFEDQVCETEVVDDGVVQVTNPYQTRQILLHADKLDKDYGASEILHLDMIDQYVLQFDTEEATKAAYEQMRPVYGDACILNLIIQGNDMLMAGTGASQTSYSWGADYMGMTRLKTSPSLDLFRDNKVTVAVIDTGIDQSNALFRGRKISGDSRNLLENSAYIYDDSLVGHGTHVAGIVADSTPNNVELMILKVFNSQGNSSIFALQAATCWAVDADAEVINMSLGIDSHVAVSAYMNPAIDYAVSNAVAICAAAGNECRDASLVYPANHPSTIAVSAIRKDESFASDYSNYGSVIDFCAPGSEINSAARGGTLKSLDGTSMASPHMAAAVAYIKMAMPDATLSQIEKVLRQYAVDLGAPGKDNYYGYGAVRMESLFDDYKPTNVSSVSNTSGGIQVKWKATAGATGYRIYRRTGSSGSWKKVKTISSGKTVKWTDKTAANGKVYNYRICTVNNAVVSGPGAKKTICRLSSTKFSSLKNASGKKVKAKWKKNSKAGGYQIEYSTSKKFTSAKKVKVSAKSTTKTISKLKKGKTYYMRIRSYKKTGGKTYYSAWSSAKKVVVRK